MHLIQSNFWLYFFLGIFPYVSCAWVITLCTSYNMLLVCTKYLESCHAYFLYIICYSVVVILFDLHSQGWINISLFELVVTCIETHIFVPSVLIYHIFISTINLFCCLLLLGQLFTCNLQHSTTHIRHHIYTTFEQI